MEDLEKRYPKFSVVIPTRNRATTLKRMLDTLLQDSYPALEIIIVDGASTDGTVELIKSYGNRISRWISEPDNGEYYALNKGIKLASGELLKLMSDDDVLRPGVFHKVADYFAAHPGVDIVFGQTEVWDEQHGAAVRQFQTIMIDESKLSLWHWLRQKQTVMSLAAFMRLKVFDRVGMLATEFVNGDVEFWARCAHRGLKMGLMPDIVVDYHYTGFNGVLVKRWGAAKGMVRICAMYGTGSDVAYSIYKNFVKPFTYRPLALTFRWSWKKIFGIDPATYFHSKHGIRA